MNSPAPKVSVIVPIYNVEPYIDECMRSLVTQTLHDIEIVCVDDCGTDKSMDIVRKYADADNRIKIIKNKQNSGIATTRNVGLDNSDAEYIMFCDPDDWFDVEMCKKMYDTITRDKTDIVMCGINIIYQSDISQRKSDKSYYKIRFLGKHAVSDRLILKCDVSVCNKIFRRDIIEKHNVRFPDGLKYEDAYFWYAYTLWAKDITFIDQKLYNYVRHDGSIMNATFSGKCNFASDHLYIAIRYHEYLAQNNLLGQKQDLFWSRMFIPYLDLALTHSKQENNTIQIARDFIVNNVPVKLPTHTAKYIETFYHSGTLQNGYYKIFFGLMKIKNTPSSMKIKLLGVPVWRVKYFDNRERFDLLAFIPVWIRKSPMARVNL